MGIQPLTKRSDNFFLLIGDWGKDGGAAGCQKKVAQMMNEYVAKYQQQGKKCLFVGALGDNFYNSGLRDDAHWQQQWGNIYGTNDPSKALHNIPWLAVLGNHDHGGSDPGCACGMGCKQFNRAPTPRPAGTEKFWIPDYSWNYEIPGAQLEIIGIDTNAVDVPNLGGDGCKNGARAACQKCGGQGKIQNFLNGEKAKGERLLDERAKSSEAKTVVIMQHYPGVGKQYKEQFEKQNGNKASVLSAYGHAHEQVCNGKNTQTGNCELVLSGGGAGWRGKGYFGFTAVHLLDDGGFKTVLETSEVRFPQNSCAFLEEETNTTIFL